jgi:hypothetical protein
MSARHGPSEISRELGTLEDEVSREKIETLDTANVAIACISFLDIGGSPAHLRRLIQRLRHRLPQGAQIIVGIWPSEDAAPRGDAARTANGADALAGSLESTVTLCVQTALRTADSEAAPLPKQFAISVFPNA